MLTMNAIQLQMVARRRRIQASCGSVTVLARLLTIWVKRQVVQMEMSDGMNARSANAAEMGLRMSAFPTSLTRPRTSLERNLSLKGFRLEPLVVFQPKKAGSSS